MEEKLEGGASDWNEGISRGKLLELVANNATLISQ